MRTMLILVAAAALGGCSLYLDDDHPPADDPPPPVALPRCAPGPVTRASTVAPALRAWILEAETAGCALATRTSSGAPDGFPTTLDSFAAPGTVRCEADGCWVALPAFARAWTEHAAPAAFTWRDEPLGEAWFGLVAAERNRDTGALRATLTAMTYGSSALRRFERRWDPAGHLLSEREWFGGALWFAIDNTWDGDRLVASRYTDTVNGTGVTEYTWRYDGGRLAAARARHDADEVEVHLAYDAAGRPTEIVRSLGELRWARQTWAYAGDGVAAATTELVPAVLAQARLVAATDDLVPLAYAGAQGEWDAADGLVATAAGCALLPHGLVYGYPEADGAYALGWAVGDRPPGIDGDYGFGNVYDTGLDRWFGHDRVEAYTVFQPWQEAEVTGALTFDGAGRMIAERVSTADGELDAVRTRSFAGGGLATDERVLRRGDQTVRSTLAFARDDDGRLIERTHRLDGRLVGRHTWSDDGASVRHAIASAFPLGEPGFPLQLPTPAPLAELPAPVVHERIAAGDGERWLRDGQLLSVRTRDGAGRITRLDENGSYQRFAYDAAGALIEYASGSDPAAPWSALSYQRDGAGRLAARTWAYGAIHDRDVLTYACP